MKAHYLAMALMLPGCASVNKYMDKKAVEAAVEAVEREKESDPKFGCLGPRPVDLNVCDQIIVRKLTEYETSRGNTAGAQAVQTDPFAGKCTCIEWVGTDAQKQAAKVYCEMPPTVEETRAACADPVNSSNPVASYVCGTPPPNSSQPGQSGPR